MNKNIDVTVFMPTYNSPIDKILLTLGSVLLQKNVKYEIIIGDDASKVSPKKAIEKFFKKNDFYNYKIYENEKNCGTVKNLCQLLHNANGEYARGVGAGDFFYDEYSLFKFVQFAKKNNADIMFCDVTYYSVKNNKVILHDVTNQPNVLKIYESKNLYPKKINYILFGDRICGTAFFYKSELFCNYLDKIVDKIIYEEDYLFFFLLADGIDFLYYPETLICYEYGTGISTSGNKYWEEKLAADDRSGELILKERYESKDKFWHMYWDIYNIRHTTTNRLYKKLKILIKYPSLLYWYIYRKIYKCRVKQNFNMSFWNKINMRDD